jgi:DNA polymerase I-like protein with 3'-5' exonuclease and polymerase domains
VTSFPVDPRSAALSYLQRGFAPLPLPHGSKKPDLEDWPNFRVSAETLNGWFDSGNIGLLLGAASGGLAAVDLDSREAYAAAQFLLPPTALRGGRGGRPLHQYFRSAGCQGRKFKDPCHRGGATDERPHGALLLEILSDGQQVVVAPSAHPNGPHYGWNEFGEPGPIDAGLLTKACARLAAAALLGRYWPAEGGRNDAHLALAGGLLRDGRFTASEARSFFRAIIQITCDEDGEEARLPIIEATVEKLREHQKVTGWRKLTEMLGDNGSTIVRTVCDWLFPPNSRTPPLPQRAKPALRVLPPYIPFPTELLPEPVRAYVEQAATALGCDPAYIALPALAAVASAIGNSRVIQLKRGWTEPSIVWSVIVGDSGTLKSPAYLRAVGPLFATQRRLLEEYKRQKAEYKKDLAAFKEAKKNFVDGEGDDPGEPPEEPTLRRVVCSDTTIEMLAVILQANPRGTLVARDELAGWLGSFCRYKGKQGGTDLPNWLELFRAGTLVVDRKTGEPKTIYVTMAATCITGGIQPGVLAKALTADFLDSGGAARLLIAMPPKRRKQWTELEVHPDAEHAYTVALERAMTLEFDEGEDGPEPHVLKLSAEAKALWVEFYNDWAAEQTAAEGEMAAALSKLEGYAARLAMLHHVVTCQSLEVDDLRQVGVRSVEAGIALVRWFANEARRLYVTLSESAEERELRRLVEFILSRGGRVTVKVLQRSNARKYPTSAAAELALEALVGANWAHWEERPAGAQGGRPTKQCVLNIAPDETDETSGDDGDGGPSPSGPPSDETPGGGDGTPGIPAENEVSSVSSDAVHRPGVAHRAVEEDQAGGGFVGQSPGGFVGHIDGETGAVTANQPPYILVNDAAGLDMVVAALDNTALVAIDTETTGLDPHSGRVRLLSLATDTVDGGSVAYLIDCFAVDPRPALQALDGKQLVFHNSEFDLPFLMRLGFTPSGPIHDTIVMSRLLTAGTRDGNDLAECAKRELGIAMDKDLQRSDWSGSLSAEQLRYAAADVLVLPALYHSLRDKVKVAGLDGTLKIEERANPAVAWMAHAGVALDAGRWREAVAQVEQDSARLERELADLAPADPAQMFTSWNFESPEQVKRLFGLLGVELASTDDNALAAVEHPLAGKLRDFRAARKLVTSYGGKFLAHVRGDGRVYPGWRQLGAGSGRMACTRPNMQQLPRDGDFRRCIHAPEGRLLVKADYSQIELRIAAKLTGDANLTEAYRRGDDVHVITAKRVLGVAEVTKEHRQLAKALNFGLLYGMGARGFRRYAKSKYGVDLSEEEATRLRDGFFAAYPGLRRWHRSMRDGAVETRTLAGRRCLGVEHFSEKLNTPVQGTGADGLKAALGLLWERRGQCPGAFPVLAVHDEVVVECAGEHVEAAAAWLKGAMVDALAPLIAPVPVEVEVRVGTNWAG